MNAFVRKLKRMNEEEIFCLAKALDAELERIERRRFDRGFTRSTYGIYMPRQRRKAPRSSATTRRRLAA